MKTRQTPVLTLATLALISTALPATASTILIASTIPAGGNVHGSAGSQVALKDSAGITLVAGMRFRVGFFVGYTSALDATLKAPGGVKIKCLTKIKRLTDYEENY